MVAVPSHLGRFDILDTLGSGTQGIVYLGYDHKLERKVAIKSIHSTEDDSDLQIELLQREARMVSQFQHPNIVIIYEVGQDEGQPFLVLEYVEGKPLDQKLADHGRYSPGDAYRIIHDLISGLAYAHEHGIIHSDLKPCNILIDEQGTPKILDFGIARHTGHKTQDGRSGTPAYMAPEYIKSGLLSPAADIFAMGLIFYEILTGAPLIQAHNEKEAFDEILNKNILPPSHSYADISAQTDALVMRCLSRDLDERYHDAGELLEVMDNLGESKQNNPALEAQRNATETFLIKRMERQGDFPSLSQSFSSLNKMFSSETDSASSVAETILKDMALTNKILRIVNSAYYSRRGGSITTISRAIVMLGFRTVRDLAASLVFVDNLENKAQAKHLRELTVRSIHSALLARNLASELGKDEPEEVFIAGMFHSLGKIATAFYLHQEYAEIERMKSQGETESSSAHKTLGTSYASLGKKVAELWHFPKSLCDSLIPPDKNSSLTTSSERTSSIAEFSNQMAETFYQSPGEAKKQLAKLHRTFLKPLKLSNKAIGRAIANANEDFGDFCQMLKIPAQKTEFGKKVHTANMATMVNNDQKKTKKIEDTISLETTIKEENDAEQILAQGMQELTTALVGSHSLMEILDMGIEILYRAGGFQRVMLCLADHQSHQVKARMGIGKDYAEIQQHFKFSEQFTPDVFHLSFNKGKDILIEDTFDIKIKKHIPKWYTKNVAAGLVVLFPLHLGKTPIGIIYADQQNGVNPPSENIIELMKTVRNQLLLAFQQSRH
ncbi:MAG: protein kinase domain-containing protein [bacterium]